jgi:hypothetical protein
MNKKNIEKEEEDSKMDLQKADVPEPLPEWIEDEKAPFPDDEDAEVIKLQVNENIEGELIDIIASTKWKGRNIYKIKEKDNDTIKVLLGTTILDRQMMNKSIGDQVKIDRIQDQPTDKGNPLQMYKTYSQKVDKDAR